MINGLSIKKGNMLGIVFVISLAIAYTRDYGDIHTGFYLQSGIGLFWIMISFVKFFYNRGIIISGFSKDVFWFLKLYLLPQIVMYLYTIILMVFGFTSWKYLGTNITSFVPIILAITSYYLFSEKSIKYICYAIILSWCISIIFAIKSHGLIVIKQAVIQGYFDHYYHVSYLPRDNYFEIHDIVLAVGFFIVYSLYSNRYIKLSNRKHNIICIICFLIMFFMGIKRIAVLGVLISYVFYIFVNHFKKKQVVLCCITACLAFLVCYTFIFVLMSGDWFFNLVKMVGVNPAGRDRYFKAILNYASFSPTYLGLGRGAVNRILTNELKNLGVAGVHSDIVKLYVENGFVLFGLWLIYYLFYIPQRILKRFNTSSMLMYVGITIYMFVLYLTDNTDTYFACQIFSVILPVSFAMNNKKDGLLCKI